MASPTYLNSTPTDLVRRKKRQSASSSAASSRRNNAASATAGDGDRWRSEKQQRNYSAKLVQALQQVRLSSSAAETPSPTAKKRGKPSGKPPTALSPSPLAGGRSGAERSSLTGSSSNSGNRNGRDRRRSRP
ncbi:unnamed protein product [Brassica napus]|nr:unnamed protein product [Brassica napus]